MPTDSYPTPWNEDERLRILKEKNTFNSFKNHQSILEVVKLATTCFQCPMSAITLVDSEKVVYLFQLGFKDDTECLRDDAFCTYTILPDADDVHIVLDATKDERFASSINVNGPLSIRFYAGAPIIYHNIKIGSLCVLDNKPHASFSKEHQNLLKEMSSIISTIFIEDEKQYILENPLILPVIKNMYQNLQNEFSEVLIMKKEARENRSKNGTLSPNTGGNMIPYESDRGSFISSRMQTLAPELLSKWTYFRNKILESIESLENKSTPPPLSELIEKNQKTKTSTSTGGGNGDDDDQNIQNFALYSFHLTNQFCTLSNWVKYLQENIKGKLDKNMEMKIKYDYEYDENDLQITHENTQWVSILLSLLFMIQLQKWKNILVNVSISGEDYILNKHANNNNNNNNNNQKNKANTNQSTNVLKSQSTKRLIVNSSNNSFMSPGGTSPPKPNTTKSKEGTTTPPPKSAATSTPPPSMALPTPSHTTTTDEIGVITLHIDITCQNKINNSSWLQDDHSFFQDMENFFIISWSLLQASYHKEDSAQTKLADFYHLSIPIICQKKGKLPISPARKVFNKNNSKGTGTPHLSPMNTTSRFNWMNSIRSFNYSFFSTNSSDGGQPSRYTSFNGDQQSTDDQYHHDHDHHHQKNNNNNLKKKPQADHPFYNSKFDPNFLTTLQDESKGLESHSERNENSEVMSGNNNSLRNGPPVGSLSTPASSQQNLWSLIWSTISSPFTSGTGGSKTQPIRNGNAKKVYPSN